MRETKSVALKDTDVPGTFTVWYENELFYTTFYNTHRLMTSRSDDLKEAAYGLGELIWKWAWHPTSLYSGMLPRCPKEEWWQKNFWEDMNLYADRARDEYGFNEILYGLTDIKGRHKECEHGIENAYPMVEDYFTGERLDFVRLRLLDKDKQPVFQSQCNTPKRHCPRFYEFIIFEKGTPVIQIQNESLGAMDEQLGQAIYYHVVSQISKGEAL